MMATETLDVVLVEGVSSLAQGNDVVDVLRWVVATRNGAHGLLESYSPTKSFPAAV
jgi:hypothetical protein